MAYFKFQTDNADYTFIAVNHFWNPTNLSLFEGIDALITESSLTDIDGSSDTQNIVFEKNDPVESLICHDARFGTKKLIELCRKGSFDLYNVDPDMNWESAIDPVGKDVIQIQREGLRNYAHEQSVLHSAKKDLLSILRPGLMMPITLWPGKIPQSLVDYASKLSLKYKLPLSTGRSVFAAEKIETALVQCIQQKSQKTRPKIAIVYGLSGHLDMVSFLQDQYLRREIIQEYQENNYSVAGISTGLLPETIDRLQTFKYLPKNEIWLAFNSDLGVFTDYSSESSKLAVTQTVSAPILVPRITHSRKRSKSPKKKKPKKFGKNKK